MLEAANNVQAQLSAQELIELATPDKATLNKLSFSKLLDLSKYLMTDDVPKRFCRKSFFVSAISFSSSPMSGLTNPNISFKTSSVIKYF
jgi:hypothetical protein